MADIIFLTMPLQGNKTDITFGSFDEAVCSVANACPKGYVSIFARIEFFYNQDITKNFGQSAINALRNALIDNSGLFTTITPTGAFLAAIDSVRKPKPVNDILNVPLPISTLIISVVPDFEVGVIANLDYYGTTGLSFTSLETIRDYILEIAT